MLRVRFLDSASYYKVDFKLVNSTTVELIGKKVPTKECGFIIYRANGQMLGDYSDYTVAKKIDGGCRFSKSQS